VQTYAATAYRALKDILGNDSVRMVAVPEEPEVGEDGKRALSPTVKLRFLSSAVSAAVAWHPDLVICLHLGTARAARVIQRVTGTPYWLVLHGIEVWKELSEPKLRALLGAERYIALSHFTFDTTVACHKISSPPPLILLPPCVDVNVNSNHAGRIAASESLPPVVLTVSRIGASDTYKGHDVMLDAWPAVLRQIPSAQYWIVGDGDARRRLESRTKEMGIAGSVRFTGAISGDELSSVYDRCTVFAMPAQTDLNPQAPRGEGFGIVYVEALGHGKPVVAPRSGAPAEYVRPGEFGFLVDPLSSADVAQALITLLENPKRASQMGEAGRKWVSDTLSYTKFCGTLRDALKTEPLRN
jgi:phosphatidyl-myo-inositol dimannoside synthase